MAIFSERFVKLKRFSQEFDFDDTANQVIPKVGAGSVIGDILASIWTALSGKHPKITGGSDGQVYTVQPDGSYAWEGVASQIQTLGISGQTLSISGGNNVTLPDKDQQMLSVSGQTLSISGGNSVTLPAGSSPAQTGEIGIAGGVITKGQSSSGSAPANGTWLAAVSNVAVTRNPTVNTSWYHNISDATHVRRNDGVWVAVGAGSNFFLPLGMWPTQMAFNPA